MVKSLLPAVSLLVVTALVAGCADTGARTTDSLPTPSAFEEVEVTDTTGAIRGVVVTEAIVPIEGVLVTLSGGANQTTDAEGAFVFSGLEPGDYFLTASKPGYFEQQASANVVAGVADPPVTKVTLLVDQAAQPFAEVLQWSAFLQCGAWLVAVTTNPCAFTGSDNVHDFEFNGRIPDYAQAEVVWSGTQPLGNWLAFSIHDPATATGSCYRVNSQSPALLAVNQTQIVDCYGDEAGLLTYKVFPGASDGTPPTPTILTNQRYDVYVQYFYGFTPREGYSLYNEGPCDTPTKCT